MIRSLAIATICVVTSACFSTAVASGKCFVADLAKRAEARERRDPTISKLKVTPHERRMAALDAEITQSERDYLYTCLREDFIGMRRAFAAHLQSTPTWHSDSKVRMLPGNDYAYGVVYSNERAKPYFDNGRIEYPVGAVIFKEVFRITTDGYAAADELIAIEKIAQGNEPSLWKWTRIDRANEVTNPHSECLSCHKQVKQHDYIFGLSPF